MTQTPRLDAAWLDAKKGASVALEAHDALGLLESETRGDLIDAQRDLVRYATRLAEKMERLVNNIEERGGDGAGINSLGEVQGSALDVDRECARVAVLRETLRGIASARKAATR